MFWKFVFSVLSIPNIILEHESSERGQNFYFRNGYAFFPRDRVHEKPKEVTEQEPLLIYNATDSTLQSNHFH